MAKGYQDFRRGIDVAQQSLSQLEQRPKLGPLHIFKTVTTILPGVNSTIISIDGKGTIFGVIILCNGDEANYNDYTKTDVDNVENFSPSWADMVEFGAMQGNFFNWILTNYSLYNGIFALARNNQTPFETSYREKYYNEATLATANITAYIAYTLI